MEIKAICYTSNTGFTEKYAKMIGDKTGLPVYSLKEAKAKLEKGAPIVYLGWLFANSVSGYKKAAKRFKVCAVCGVGLCDTGALIEEVRKATSLPGNVPLFTMQGGMDKSKLRGIKKMLINMLTKGLASQKERTEQEERMLYLLQTPINFVSEDNIRAFLEWYDEK